MELIQNHISSNFIELKEEDLNFKVENKVIEAKHQDSTAIIIINSHPSQLKQSFKINENTYVFFFEHEVIVYDQIKQKFENVDLTGKNMSDLIFAIYQYNKQIIENYEKSLKYNRSKTYSLKKKLIKLEHKNQKLSDKIKLIRFISLFNVWKMKSSLSFLEQTFKNLSIENSD